MAPIDLNKRCFCVISGASRGIGRTFAVELAKKFAAGSQLVLLARNKAQLEALKEEVEVATENKVKVTVAPLDLQKPNESELKGILSLDSSFELAICVHNVGTLGDCERWVADESDVQKWSKYFEVNLFNVILLNNLFMAATKDVSSRLILNVTSLCAIEAMKSMAYYCTGKAAREMFFRVLALENPEVTVLNYSPGMVDTDMAAELRTNPVDQELKEYAQGVHNKKELLSTLQTTEKMLDVVAKGEYKSGDHVDYHDKK